MDIDYNSQSEEEEEYMYDDASIASGEEGALSDEVETTSEGDEGSVKTGHKRNWNERDNDSAIHMMDSKEIFPMMKKRIFEVTEVLNIPASAACPLLRNHKWTQEVIVELYMDNDEKVQKQAGVFARCGHPGPKITSAKRKCDICIDDDLPPHEMLSMPCGHEFCRDCWAGFIKSKISDGPSCIRTTCPQAGCTEVITEEEVEQAAPDLLEKFEGYQLRNFVELNGTSRWCPGPGCERIAALNSTSGIFNDSDNVIADCDACTTRFCIKCGEEPHAPLSCKSLELWKEKCKNESETANWILANTKSCPECTSRIEKNQGCNHMTCQHCKYEFCWICSGDWKAHNGNYSCNQFHEDGEGNNNQSDAAKAKMELERYLHYYSRYHVHAEAQKFAKKQLLETESRMILLQETNQSCTWTDVEFLRTANAQLLECRLVLKFTYAFGYYLTEQTKQKELFEFHQSTLERYTETLSELVEKSNEEIDRDRVKVIDATRFADQFMKKMLQYVEDGMDESEEIQD